MVGCNREDVIGRAAKELNLWTDAQQEDLKCQQLANHDPAKFFEVRFQSRSGEIRLAIRHRADPFAR
jgi:hypothetical protein